jgi:hypothetical protein
MSSPEKPPGDSTEKPREKRKRKPVDNVPTAPPSFDMRVLDVLNPLVRQRIEPLVRDIVEDVQSTKDDPVWKAALANWGLTGAQDYYERATQGQLPSASDIPEPDDKGVSENNHIVKAEVWRNMKSATEEFKQANVTQAGKWTPKGVARGPAAKDASYDLVLLNEISQVMINAVKSTEVEAMVLEDRILVSANEAATVEALCSRSLKELFTSKGGKVEDWARRKQEDLTSLMSGLTGTGADDRLVDIGVASNLYPDQSHQLAAFLEILKSSLEIVDGGEPQRAGSFIMDDEYAGRIIAVSAANGYHAEQSLALALMHGGYSGAASIAGGKRPCQLCLFSLILVQENGFPNLRFNRVPGGLWDTTPREGLVAICNLLGFKNPRVKKEMAKFFAQGMPTHVTDPRPDAPLNKTVELPKELSNKSLLTKAPTFAVKPTYDKMDYEEFIPPADTSDDESGMSEAEQFEAMEEDSSQNLTNTEEQ